MKMKTPMFITRIEVWLKYLLKAKTLYIYLKSGVILKGRYFEDDYEDIYYAWSEGEELLTFNNAEVKISEISAIRWDY